MNKFTPFFNFCIAVKGFGGQTGTSSNASK